MVVFYIIISFSSKKVLNVGKAVFVTSRPFLESFFSNRPHDRQFLVGAHHQSVNGSRHLQVTNFENFENNRKDFDFGGFQKPP